jgi:hypothetical protein
MPDISYSDILDIEEHTLANKSFVNALDTFPGRPGEEKATLDQMNFASMPPAFPRLGTSAILS